MRAITVTEARKNLASELDRVANDCDVTVITRQNAEPGVLMSMRDSTNRLWKLHTSRVARAMKLAERLRRAAKGALD
jgi:antitoxin YefM